MDEIIKKIGSKNMIKIGIGTIAIISCIVIGSLIYHTYFYKKSFSEIENIMVNAAKEYYSDHSKELPNESGETINIKASTLISGEYMKSIPDYLKDDEILCKGSVNVTNSNGNYRYNPLLDCGNDYSYQFLVDHIKKEEEVVENGDGLYNINDTLVYRGEKVKNNVLFANHSYRIVKIVDNKLILILNEKFEKTSWDDRYNKDKESNIGINNYQVSRIKDYLNDLYKENTLFSDDNKLLLTNFNLDIGKVGEEDNDKSGELEKATKLENQYIGLLPLYDFMNASLDSNCSYTTDATCSNYNYLMNFEYNFWLITADKNTTYNVYQALEGEGVYTSKAIYSSYVRPVIAISPDAIYISGDGSSSKPYKFK
jgi:hypothetical protein